MLMPLAMLVTSAVALGQPAAQRLQVADLERVEGRVGDRNVLSSPGRVMPAQLAVPIGFEGVYRIPLDADTPYAGWFARASGGVIAAFPASEYRFDKDIGVIPDVPSGTMYFMGGIPVRERVTAQDGARPLSARPLLTALPGLQSGRLNMSVRPARPDDRVVLPSQRAATHDASSSSAQRATQRTERLILDDGYRAQRVSHLLERAAGARLQN